MQSRSGIDAPHARLSASDPEDGEVTEAGPHPAWRPHNHRLAPVPKVSVASKFVRSLRRASPAKPLLVAHVGPVPPAAASSSGSGLPEAPVPPAAAFSSGSTKALSAKASKPWKPPPPKHRKPPPPPTDRKRLSLAATMFGKPPAPPHPRPRPVGKPRPAGKPKAQPKRQPSLVPRGLRQGRQDQGWILGWCLRVVRGIHQGPVQGRQDQSVLARLRNLTFGSSGSSATVTTLARRLCSL